MGAVFEVSHTLGVWFFFVALGFQVQVLIFCGEVCLVWFMIELLRNFQKATSKGHKIGKVV